ncbi:hypothetical protein BJ944DRAFT_34362 [Cunninghamella echinulata]|nr:hypothetical protein BJ944DRAFT_34362 [Cunninghamella echinulata]
MAKVININIDSRREIDQEIKKVCEEFTTECISAVIEPLSTFMIKLSAVKDIKDDGNESLIDSKINKIVAQFQEAAEERLKYVVRNLQDYINDKKMEQILLKPIEVNVIEYYKSFYQMVTSNNNNNNNNNTKLQQPLENTLPSISSISEFINNAINSNTV